MKPFSPKEAAVKLGVCKKTVLRYIANGSIQAAKLSKKTIRISEESLNRYIEEHTM